jgi:hypothetical protein
MWVTSPTDHETCVTKIQNGDIGWIEDGKFKLICNVIDRNKHPAPYRLPDYLPTLQEPHPDGIEFDWSQHCNSASTLFASEAQRSLALELGVSRCASETQMNCPYI